MFFGKQFESARENADKIVLTCLLMPNSTDSDSTLQSTRAPRGTQLHCKGWQQEAALRMLMNSFDEGVMVGKQFSLHPFQNSALLERDWKSYEKIAWTLKELGKDETLLVKADGTTNVFKTQEASPRVLILNSGEPEKAGPLSDATAACRMMEGSLAQNSWMVDTFQESLHFTFQILAAIADKYFTGDLAGKLIVNCGMEAIGSLMSVAATMNGAAFLGIDADPEKIKRQLKAGRCDFMVNSLDEALRILKNAVRKKENVSVGLVADCGEIIQKFSERGVLPEVINIASGAASVSAAVVQHAQSSPDFVTEYISPIFDSGRRPFRWFALSGEPADIFTSENILLELFPENRTLRRWIEIARKRIKFQGLPSRICWLDSEERGRFVLAIHQFVKDGKIKAPVVVGIDQFELQSSFGLTESLLLDAAMDVSTLQKLLANTEGAAWISLQKAEGIMAKDTSNQALMSITRAIVIDGDDATISRMKIAIS